MENHTIKLELPGSMDILVYKSVDPASEPDTWIISAIMQAPDVETGERGTFSIEWRGSAPSTETIAQTVINMIAHEVFEQLGMSPHQRAAVEIPSAP